MQANPDSSSPTSATKTRTLTIQAPTSSATQSAVTSGTTGIADFTCTDNAGHQTYTTASGAKFIEECYADYGNVDGISAYTVYTFQSCMNQCVIYNAHARPNETLCGAVSYSANLTQVLGTQGEASSYGGNCFLKAGRGDLVTDNVIMNYRLMGSAYLLG